MTPWTRYGREGGACIETRVEGDEVWIRDSERPGEYPLPAASWEAFLAAVRAPVEAERDEARAAIRRVHQAVRDHTTAAAVALALCSTATPDRPSMLDELAELRAQLAAAAPVLDAATAALVDAQTAGNATFNDLIDIAPEPGVREGWYRATCWDCWTTTGSEPVVEEAAYEHISDRHADRIRLAASAIRLALAPIARALDGVSPEGTARPPGAPQAAPQAPDVAQGTDGLEAHRGAEEAQGGPVAPGQIYLVGEAVDG